MFADCITCFRFNNGFLKKQLADVPPDQFDTVPADGHKAPRWILGHLAEGQFYLAMFLGLTETHPFPDDWAKAFAPGTPSLPPYGLDDDAEQPPVEGLLDYIRSTEEPIIEAALAVPEGSLTEPHGVDLLDGTGIDTKADLVAHLLTSHYAFHLGQLSIWRRCHDVAPLF